MFNPFTFILTTDYTALIGSMQQFLVAAGWLFAARCFYALWQDYRRDKCARLWRAAQVEKPEST